MRKKRKKILLFTINAFSIGIPFVITNYRKGVLFAIFRERSGAELQYSTPHARKKSLKNALFSVLRIFADEKPTALRLV